MGGLSSGLHPPTTWDVGGAWGAACSSLKGSAAGLRPLPAQVLVIAPPRAMLAQRCVHQRSRDPAASRRPVPREEARGLQGDRPLPPTHCLWAGGCAQDVQLLFSALEEALAKVSLGGLT